MAGFLSLTRLSPIATEASLLELISTTAKHSSLPSHLQNDVKWHLKTLQVLARDVDVQII